MLLKRRFYTIYLFVCLFWVPSVSAQNYADKDFYLVDSLSYDRFSDYDAQLVDSIMRLYHQEKEDTSKIKLLGALCEEMLDDDWTKYQFYLFDVLNEKLVDEDNLSKEEVFFYKENMALSMNNVGLIYNNRGDLEKAMEFYQSSLSMLESIGSAKGIGNPLCNIGLLYNNKGELDKAIEHYEKGLSSYEQINDTIGIAMATNNMGAIYDSKGDITKALQYYHDALNIYEDFDDQSGVALTLNNIGAVYKNQGNINKAFEYWNESLDIREKAGDNYGLGYSLNNLASLYVLKGDTLKAIEFLKRSLSIRESREDKRGMSQSLNALGDVYSKKNEHSVAFNYYFRSLEIKRELSDKEGIVVSLNSMADLALKSGDVNAAGKYARESKLIAQQIGFPSSIRDAAKIISKIAKSQGNWKEAYLNQELYYVMNDSIVNLEIAKSAFQKEVQHKYEKQADSVSAVQIKKEAVAFADQQRKDDISQKETEKKNLIIWASSGGLLLLVVFLIFVFNRLKVAKRQKAEIDKQKAEIEDTHEQLAEHHKEISDSIVYAKNLQQAILPSKEELNKELRNGFVLFKPKDVVSGDFYWLEKVGDVVLFAAADCTGHGVPGAMVSVVCSNALDRAVKEFGITDTGKILDKVTDLVVERFEKSGEDVRDGMDISLCALNWKTNSLQYSGANNPLWIVRKRNGKEVLKEKSVFNEDYYLEDIKGSSQPIGKFEKRKPFESTRIKLDVGDVLYAFTDGYADQFGGRKGKKFKYKPFKNLLLDLVGMSMDQQQEKILSAFIDWKGDLEQIDDVCVIGVKI